MWVKCHSCNGTGMNPKRYDIENKDKIYHEDGIVSIHQCIDCYIWYIMSSYSNKGYIWVDDSEDPISPLPSPS